MKFLRPKKLLSPLPLNLGPSFNLNFYQLPTFKIGANISSPFPEMEGDTISSKTTPFHLYL